MDFSSRELYILQSCLNDRIVTLERSKDFPESKEYRALLKKILGYKFDVEKEGR